MWSTKTIYNFEHFKSMENLEAVGWINQRSEILNQVVLALHNPDGLAPDRKKWMEILVEHPLDSCAKRIVKSLS
jgi:aspartate/tyrosine/aromatic aminotransferase